MKKFFIFVPVAFFILIFFCGCQTFGAKRTILFQDSTPVDDYQILILLSRRNFNYKAAQPDGSDVRVFDAQDTLLYHWIENWNPYGLSLLWVRIPRAGTEQIVIKCGDPGDTPGSDGTKVFDPITWEELKTGWLYSGIKPGRVSGWEDPLTEFDLDANNWTPVEIDTDYVEECEHSRWFIRREVFLAGGEITFSGQADDDVVWSLIGCDELYKKVGGNELDSDGENPGDFTGRIVVDQPFGHFILAGRGQQGHEEALLKMVSVDSGMDLFYTRKIAGAGDEEEPDAVLEEEEEKVEDAVEEETGEDTEGDAG
jgi:hypothetical protein